MFVVTREDEDSYQVRAIFDNAGFIIPGEDVKIAGVKVGKVSDLEVTDDFKAAVVLEITEPGYQDFRRDASCIVRPQNLIGERFVECKPTQPRTANAEPPPQLREIEDGPGEGQYLLPVENTMQTVDIDLIGNTMREPERERLSLILNELGTGVAGRGKDLNEVIRRANPALQETDKVLADPGPPERPARAAGGQLGHGAGAAGARPRAGRERDPQLERGRARRRPRSATRWPTTSRRCRASSTSSSRRWCASARWPTSPRRC